MNKILIADDNQQITSILANYARKEGFEPLVALDGQQALELFEQHEKNIDVVLLDVMMPKLDGFEVCRAIRAKYKGVILMLTARDEDLDQILGLELGADDYIAKPVQPRLLLARIKALLRRAPGSGESGPSADETDELEFGNFRISQATRNAHLGEDIIDLTTAEFDLLWLLARHAGNILSRDDLLQELRGIGFDGLDRSIDARISRLRRKLGDDPENPTRIKTVRGKGYLFSKHDWQ